MEINNLGLKTALQARPEFETQLDKLAATTYDMHEALLSVGLTTLGCASNSCKLSNLSDDLPDICIIDLVDWIDELAHDNLPHDKIINRARQLDATLKTIVDKVEPVTASPASRHDLPFLLRGLAHPRVTVCLEDMHRELGRIANFQIETMKKAA